MKTNLHAQTVNSNETPNKWGVIKLGDHAYIKARIGWRGLSSSEYTNDGPYLVAGNHIVGSRIMWEKCDHITGFRYEESPEIQLDVNDVIISKDGTIGRVGFVDTLPSSATINGTMMLIRPSDDVFYPKYIYFYLQGDYFQRIVQERISGSSVPHIFQRDMVNLQTLVPPKAEQKRITHILTSVDEVIEKTEAQISKLQDLKKGMMQELLTKGIGHTEFKDSPVGRIPKGWEAKKISALVDSGVIDSIQDGNHGELHPKASDYAAKGIPFVMASDIRDGEIDVEKAKKIPEAVYKRLRIGFAKPGDVLLTHKATIGATAIVPDSLTHLMLTPQVTYYRIGRLDILDNRFLLYFFQSPNFQRTITNLSAQSTRNYIGITAQKDLYVVLPSNIEEQRIIAKTIRSVDDKLTSTNSRLMHLRILKKALMQDLLTGKVRVKVN